MHLWEHRDVLKRLRICESERAELQRFTDYLIPRLRAQILVINEHIPNGPVIAASMLDDIDDAIQVSKVAKQKMKGKTDERAD